jgi:hypothetical protein
MECRRADPESRLISVDADERFLRFLRWRIHHIIFENKAYVPVLKCESGGKRLTWLLSKTENALLECWEENSSLFRKAE